MDLDLTKVLSQLLLLLGRDILVPEKDNAPLCNQQAQLIPLLVGKVLQLQAHDLRSNVPCEMDDLLRGREQGFLLWVSASRRVNMRAVVVADIVHIINKERTRRAIWVSSRKVNAISFQPYTSGWWKGKSVLPGLSDVDYARIYGSRSHVTMWYTGIS